MSWLVLLLIIIVVVMLIGFVLRMLKGAVKLVATLLVIVVLVSGAIWIFVDINNLRNHFYQDEKLFVLDIDGRAAGAFTLGGEGVADILEDLSEIRTAYPDVSAIKKDYYKVVVITWPVVARDIALEGFSASKEEIRKALLSENPKQLFIDKGVEAYGKSALAQIKLQADSLYPTRDAFASTAFAVLAEQPLSNPDVMFAGIKQGTVIIYPETITFKILRILPESFTSVLAPSH